MEASGHRAHTDADTPIQGAVVAQTVHMVTRLYAGQPENRSSIVGSDRLFFVTVHNSPGTHPASYLVGTHLHIVPRLGMHKTPVSLYIFMSCNFIQGVPAGKFQDRAISLYSNNIVDKKEILVSVFNTGIYSSSDKVDTVSYNIFFFENCTVNIRALCKSCKDMACCSSVQCPVYCTVK
jgi:hypothetical protein